ncbi:hypothetical protein LFY73_004634 [Escherichia coli]|nr:hypothetical protein [Escherichia coli]EER3452346.1 hypothetical protein [Escherichia coli]EER6062243.1 hypothetical protein [Escherichia coli]EEX7669238.1 hypothetical protein [Escherichia coli]EFE9563671.1 hypothetical protein [Escherichia coli]
MKKSLIALMIAAGATVSVSGVAHAFSPSFSGDNISFSGTLTTPVAGVFEGKVSSLTGLDATIKAGESSVTIPVATDKGLLVLRSVSGGFDSSASNKIANITFNGKTLAEAAGGSRFTEGKINLTLDAQNNNGVDIGTITLPIQVAGVSVTVDNTSAQALGESLVADSASYAFHGGLPVKPDAAISSYDVAFNTVGSMAPDATEYFPVATEKADAAVSKSFSAENKKFHAAYAAGIRSGDNITLNLSSPATAGAPVEWTASVPVVVTYK